MTRFDPRYEARGRHDALLLVGFQNDFFHPDGALHPVVEPSLSQGPLLESTLAVIEGALERGTFVVSLPMLFSDDYSEMRGSAGVLDAIRESGAFRRDSFGGETVPEIRQFGRHVETFHGKTGFNAFHVTGLDPLLRSRWIRNVCIAGVVTSVCVDSTARAAAELGYPTTVLSDCTAAKTPVEQEFYCEHVFPSYADVQSGDAWLAGLGEPRGGLRRAG